MTESPFRRLWLFRLAALWLVLFGTVTWQSKMTAYQAAQAVQPKVDVEGLMTDVRTLSATEFEGRRWASARLRWASS